MKRGGGRILHWAFSSWLCSVPAWSLWDLLHWNSIMGKFRASQTELWDFTWAFQNPVPAHWPHRPCSHHMLYTVLHIPQGTRYCSQVNMVPKAWHNTSALGLHGAESTHTSPLPQPCGHPICVYPVAGMEPAGMAASRAAVGCPTQLEESEWLGLEGTLKFIQFQPCYRGKEYTERGMCPICPYVTGTRRKANDLWRAD